jgi:nucleotidyltransferase AbiEii toxin of type IV toxin-antitoxin system
MLRKETVTSATLELLKELMGDSHLKDFFLVGGTALSLQIGHRISVDIEVAE